MQSLRFMAPAIQSRFAISNAQLELLFAAHSAPDVLSPIIGALLARQFGPQSILMLFGWLAVAGASLQAVSIGFYPSLTLMYLGTALAGLSFGVVKICAQIWVCALFRISNLASAFAALVFGHYIGLCLCGLFAFDLASAVAARADIIFFTSAALAAVMLLVLVFMSGSTSPEYRAGKGAFDSSRNPKTGGSVS